MYESVWMCMYVCMHVLILIYMYNMYMYVYIGGSKQYGDEVSEDKDLVIMLTYAGVC